MFYVNVSYLDWDDYPVGTPTKIGPFADQPSAEAFLEASPRFTKVTEYGYDFYKLVNAEGHIVKSKHSVSIRTVTSDFASPAYWS